MRGPDPRDLLYSPYLNKDIRSSYLPFEDFFAVATSSLQSRSHPTRLSSRIHLLGSSLLSACTPAPPHPSDAILTWNLTDLKVFLIYLFCVLISALPEERLRHPRRRLSHSRFPTRLHVIDYVPTCFTTLKFLLAAPTLTSFVSSWSFPCRSNESGLRCLATSKLSDADVFRQFLVTLLPEQQKRPSLPSNLEAFNVR